MVQNHSNLGYILRGVIGIQNEEGTYKKIIEQRFKNEYCALAERHHTNPTKRFYHFGRVIDVTDNSVFVSTAMLLEKEMKK